MTEAPRVCITTTPFLRGKSDGRTCVKSVKASSIQARCHDLIPNKIHLPATQGPLPRLHFSSKGKLGPNLGSQ